jgi:chemotaxis methyl-accepting protein methylase
VSVLQKSLSLSAMSPTAPDPTDPLRHLDFTGVPRKTRWRRRHVGTLRLRQRASAPFAGTQTTEPINPFIAWVFNQAGLDAGRYRSAALHRRLGACLRALRASCVEDARAIVERDPARLKVALSALLLGVTQFFRDPAVFEDLRRLMPGLAHCGRGLRVWSAACSQGQELYSLAMTLLELDLLSGSELLGTDCRADAIAGAARGEYAQAEVEGLRPDLRDRCFVPVEGRPGFLRVAADVRRHTGWQTDDLLRGGRPGPWDLICWRNHAIYLEPAATESVWRRLVKELRPGGLLVTGRAERPNRLLPLRRIAGCIYRKHENDKTGHDDART